MIVKDFAAKFTTGTLDTDLTVESGNPVLVAGWMINNLTTTTSHVVDMVDADDNVLLSTLLSSRGSRISDIPFIADNGIKFTASSGATEDISVTVFHSHPGA
jgi:hypothetical protein